ncbi:hypothetical protein Vadar_019442 [Vaccinium darrowii]|uniref:Uncharacterized protein n=1 Tax=Vaccinium darrowii TaxID=229202 RepID=A0ACB7YN75_9ERIC|nr:hypothetical protein Vadar_019442 [Vaccinium darrowii]
MKEDTNISNYCKFDNQLLISFTSSLYVASLIASFFASSVTQAFGRKPSIFIGGVAFLVGAALSGVAFNVYMLIFGRVFLSVGVGFVNQSVPLYLSEMFPPIYRGAINNGFIFSVNIGAVSANLINYGTKKITGGWCWRISLGMAAVPASILTLGALFLPETPHSLIQLNIDPQAAKSMLQRIRGTRDVQSELDDLIKAREILKSVKHPFKKIVQKKYRSHLAMAILIIFFRRVSGIDVILFYGPVIFQTMGIGESASLMSAIMSTIVLGVVAVMLSFISMLIVDKLGRRILLMAGGIQMLVSQVMIGVVLAIQSVDNGGVNEGYAVLVLVLICVCFAGYEWSWSPLRWLIPSEIFPLEIRSEGLSIIAAANLLFTFVGTQTFLAMLCRFKSGIFFFSGGWVVLMTVFVYLFLPETKNVPIEQMDKVMWREHWL